MALRHPRRPEPEPVRELNLFEEVLEHHPFRRHVPIDLGLRDGEEDVELHAADRIGRRWGVGRGSKSTRHQPDREFLLPPPPPYSPLPIIPPCRSTKTCP